MQKPRNGLQLPWMSKIEAIRPFSEDEAWYLYRLGAFGEAIGWSLLITGILIERFHLPGHGYAVPIAGQIHGMLFLLYFGLLLATYTSLRWSRTRFVFAAAAGVVPFGTLLFEQWVEHADRHARSRNLLCNSVLALVSAQV